MGSRFFKSTFRTPASSLVILAVIHLLFATVLANNPDGSCSAASACTSGCCGKSGYCGFGPAFCGAGNCTSTCNAQAECGQYAPAGHKTCPLNVCCSQYGFCGTTSDFCGTGCQNGCSVPNAPACSSNGGSSSMRTIGYYESWSYTRTCDTWTPEAIDPTKWTHLNYAFALIGSDFRISQMNSFDTQLYPRFTGLKSQNPSLKAFISVGGWSAGGQIFSQMCSSSGNRNTFIQSLIAFMSTYGFDGVDIDWEYPVAPDRQGDPSDFVNYVSLLRELKSAIGNKYGISITIPTSYWYMQHFDIVNIEPYIDFFNLMAYDLHGTWDGNNPYTQAVVAAHTNLTEIDNAMQLLWRNNISPAKVVLGLGFYGRSFTLSSSSCTAPGCAFSGGGTAGNCTGASGILSYAEIQRTITQYSLTPTLDKNAAAKWITWNSNQWVSYDDSETFGLKLQYADSKCLTGTMVWAVDLDSDTNPAVDALNSGSYGSSSTTGIAQKQLNAQMKFATSSYNGATLGVFWTPCLPPGSQDCPPGYQALTRGHGKVFDIDLNHISGEGCHGGGNGFNRVLCAPNALTFSHCAWGAHNAGLCNAKCPNNWIQISKNTHVGGNKIGCDVLRYTPYCCQTVTGYSPGYCYATSLDHVLSGSLAARQDPSGVTEYVYSNLANSKKKRDESNDTDYHPAVAERNKDLEANMLSKRGDVTYGAGCLGSGFLPIGAIPVDIPVYLYESRVYGGYSSYYVSLSNAPTASPTATSKGRKTVRTTVTIDTTTYSTMSRTCDGSKYPQACLNYRSIGSNFFYGTQYRNPTCAPSGVKVPPRPLVTQYNKERNNQWVTSWITSSYVNPNNKRRGLKCERDEWPPAHFQQGLPNGFIRLLPSDQNGAAANDKGGGWVGFCQYPPKQQTSYEGGPVSHYGDIVITTIYRSQITTLNVMSYNYKNMPVYPNDYHGLTTNPCYPATLIQDPGFALLNEDDYYYGRAAYQTLDYKYAPAAFYTSGKKRPYKRSIIVSAGLTDEDHFMIVDSEPDTLTNPGADAGTYYLDDTGDRMIHDNGNITRVVSDEELYERFDLERCGTPDCLQEQAELAELARLIREDEEGVILGALSSEGASVITSPGGKIATSSASLQGSSVLSASLNAPSKTASASRASSAAESLVTIAPRVTYNENGDRVIVQDVEEVLTPEKMELRQRKAELLARRVKRRARFVSEADFTEDMWIE